MSDLVFNHNQHSRNKRREDEWRKCALIVLYSCCRVLSGVDEWALGRGRNHSVWVLSSHSEAYWSRFGNAIECAWNMDWRIGFCLPSIGVFSVGRVSSTLFLCWATVYGYEPTTGVSAGSGWSWCAADRTRVCAEAQSPARRVKPCRVCRVECLEESCLLLYSDQNQRIVVLVFNVFPLLYERVRQSFEVFFSWALFSNHSRNTSLSEFSS